MNKVIEIDDELTKKICEFEGCRLKAYKCPAGVLTIGFGHTHGVVEGMEIGTDTAYMLLNYDILTCILQLQALYPKQDITHTGLGIALTDFVFNLGMYSYLSSTLKRVVDLVIDWRNVSDDLKEMIAEQLRRWVHSRGIALAGLKKRREWEISQLYNYNN